MTKFKLLMIGASLALFSAGAANAQDKPPMTPGQNRPVDTMAAPHSAMPMGRSESMGTSRPNSPSSSAHVGESGKTSGTKQNPKVGE